MYSEVFQVKLCVTSQADMYKHCNRIIQHSNLWQYYSEPQEKKIVVLEYKKRN